MHNVLQVILSEIHTIPMEILQLAFNPKDEPVSLDELIIEKVIKKRVLPGCNLVAGEERPILLKLDYWEPLNYSKEDAYLRLGRYSTYRIPPEARDYRPITKTISIDYPGYTNNILTGIDPYRQGKGARVASLTRAVMQSHTKSQFIATPTATAKDGEIITLLPGQTMHIEFVVHCLLEYDDNFNNINASAVIPLAQLCLCAVKAYIFRTTMVAMDQGRILHGGDHGIIKELIADYRGEEEKYQELLDEFTGGAKLNEKSMARIIYNWL